MKKGHHYCYNCGSKTGADDEEMKAIENYEVIFDED